MTEMPVQDQEHLRVLVLKDREASWKGISTKFDKSSLLPTSAGERVLDSHGKGGPESSTGA